jgi:hypothetical protein|tara:strand:- start:390 stop:1166 length:777 start_codon:yes stop_codon:yes gene_type:complete
MNKILIFLLLFTFPAFAKEVIVTGKHSHEGDTTRTESCAIAEERAMQNGIKEALGIEVAAVVVSNCSEIDGELDCERHQLSILKSKGEIVKSEIIGKPEYGPLEGTDMLYCKITIKAEVIPIPKNEDPTFQYKVELNQNIFREGEKMKIDISAMRKMYLSIFQWLPYAKANQIIKIFPNKKFNKDTDNQIIDNKKLMYEVYFPEDIKKRRIDEYLIFIASEEQINWFNDYKTIELLYNELTKKEILMEKKEYPYIIVQ